MNICEISRLENRFEKFVQIYESNPQDIILYGAGRGSDWVIKLLLQTNIHVLKIVDRRVSGERNGIPIIKHEEFLKEYRGQKVYIIISSPKFEDEIFKILSSEFDSSNIFSFESELYYHYIPDVNSYRKYLLNNEAAFMQLYDKLEDNLSKNTLECVLKGRVSGNWQFFKQVCRGDQYFAKDIIKLGSEEVFLDVGAFTGDTIDQIVKVTRGGV